MKAPKKLLLQRVNSNFLTTHFVKKFEWTIEKIGEIVRGKGTACKNSDGDWVTLGNIMM